MFLQKQSARILAISIVISAAIMISGVIYRHIIVDSYKLQSQEYNFGEANIDEHVKHVFTIRNPLNIPLHIEGAKSSCSCSVVGELPESIPPRSSCKVPVEVSLNIEGKKVGSRTVLSFREHEPITLGIVGTVYRQYPSVLEFGYVKRGIPVEKIFHVRSLRPDNLSIDDIKYNKAYFKVTHTRASSDPRHAAVKVTLKEDIPYGPFESAMQITTSDDSPKIKSISVKGYVKKPIEAQPARLAFGLIRPDEEKTANIRLSAPYGGIISIESIEVIPKDIVQVDATRTVPVSNGVEIPVVLKGGFDKKILKGIVKIHVRVGQERRKCNVDFYAMSSKI